MLRWCNLAEESSDKTVTSARLNSQFGVKIVAWPYSRWVAECLSKTFQPSQQDPTDPADARHGPIAFRILTLPTTTASVVVGWGGVLSDTWSQAWWNTLSPAMYVTVRCYDPVARHSRAAERWW